MRSHYTFTYRNLLRVPLLLISCLTGITLAQNFVPPSPVPPDLGFLPGGASRGQIESVNPIAGNLTLSFPVGSLPAGPGGLSISVNLTYNSAFYTSEVDDNGSDGAQLRIMYKNQPSSGWNSGTWLSGGWSYSFRYNLWSAAEPSGVPAGNTMYLTTPDGANHLLLLISALKPDGSAASSTFHQNYPNQPVYDINFAGLCVDPSNTACTQGVFAGTLVFASVDSSYIRVESDTVNKTWTAFFADGTKVSGNFNPPGATIGDVLAAEWNKIEDKNGNTLNLVNFCIESSTCITRISDQYGREVDIEYGSANNFPWNWTDTISQPGANGRIQTLVNWARKDFSGPSYDCIYRSAGNFSTCSLTGAGGTIVTPYVVESIQLPPGAAGGPSTVYTFDYDVPSGSSNWGELHTMTRKTLASGTDVSSCLLATSSSCPQQYQVNYTYYFDNPSHKRVMGTLVNPVSSKVLTYSENRDGTTTQLPSETTAYAIPVPASFDPTKPSPVGGTSTITAPDGSQTTIYSGPAPSCTNIKSGLCSAVVYKIANPDGTQTETAWTSSALPPAAPSGSFVNPYAQYTVHTVGSKAMGTSVEKDSNGNTTSVSEYDWFNASLINRSNGMLNGIPGSSTRTTSSTYYATTEYWNRGTRYLRALKTNSVGTSSTTNSYDDDDPLTTANLTKQSLWNSESKSNITRSWTYKLPSGAINGNVVTETDPNGIITQTTYDTSGLYPTQVDVALGKAEQRTTKPTYDFASGLMLSSTDDDNKVTTKNTYDNLGRIKKVEQSGKGVTTRSTSSTYDDAAMSVTTTQDQTGLSSTTYYDPLGRVRLAIDAAGNKIQKAYRVGTAGVTYQLESNPYTTIDQSMGWTLTTTTVSATTSTVSVQTYRGTDPPAPWGSAPASALTGTATSQANDSSTSTCSGPTTNVTDQASNTTKYCQDGLGRLVGVTDPAGNLTQYSYDLLDNLIKVTQAGQVRTFEYSSLGRLLKACNPESATANCATSPLASSGLDQYTYDPNGNLLTHTDARGVTKTVSSYDGLNRPTGAPSITYTANVTNVAATSPVTFTYDQDWKGALSSVSTTIGGKTYSMAYTHDGFGRVGTSTQTTAGTAYVPFEYQYSPTDQLTQIKYPSGRTVVYGLDGTQRAKFVQNQATGSYYANNINYTASGGVSSLTLGNGITEKNSWNDRLQLTGTNVSLNGVNLLKLDLYPCPSGETTACATGNTGNIHKQTIAFDAVGSAPGLSRTQNYAYDPLSRLIAATESATGPDISGLVSDTDCSGSGVTSTWWQRNCYDASGNRWLNPNAYQPSSPFTQTASTNYSDGKNHVFVNMPSGVTNPFDAAGNLTTSGGYTSTFDAEGRMVSNSLNASTTYVYDGEGRRVMKQSASGSTVYVYDAFGHLAAEYASSAPVGTTCATSPCYLTVDQIGSTRLVTDRNGAVAARYDYLPFGEEILADGSDGNNATTGRTTAMGYQSAFDWFNPRFTGQYRDGESRLDYFNARYFSPAQGRFVSPDPGNAGADPNNPQTWNAYAYVGNNPLNITDPAGTGWFGDFMYSLIHGILDTASGHLWGLLTSALNGTPPGPGMMPGIGDLGLFGCNGPLGGCGADTSPWSEDMPELHHTEINPLAVMTLQGSARVACAADFGNAHSVAAGVEAMFPSVKSNAAAKFGVSLFGGNTVSGLANLGLYINGTKTPSGQDLAKIPFKGVGQGLPLPPGEGSQFRTIWTGATGTARGQMLRSGATTAYNTVRGVGQGPIQLGISSAVGSSAAGLSARAAANFSNVVGYAKFLWDAGTFAWGYAKCGR